MANSSSGWKFWTGLFAGIAAGLYLNSNHGRTVRKNTEAQLERMSADITERTRRELESLSQKTTEALETSKGKADKTGKDLKESIHKLAKAAEEAVDKTETSYEKAADWAVEKLKKNNLGEDKA